MAVLLLLFVNDHDWSKRFTLVMKPKSSVYSYKSCSVALWTQKTSTSLILCVVDFPNVIGPNGCFGDASFTTLAYGRKSLSASESHEDVITRFSLSGTETGRFTAGLFRYEALKQLRFFFFCLLNLWRGFKRNINTEEDIHLHHRHRSDALLLLLRPSHRLHPSVYLRHKLSHLLTRLWPTRRANT